MKITRTWEKCDIKRGTIFRMPLTLAERCIVEVSRNKSERFMFLHMNTGNITGGKDGSFLTEEEVVQYLNKEQAIPAPDKSLN